MKNDTSILLLVLFYAVIVGVVTIDSIRLYTKTWPERKDRIQLAALVWSLIFLCTSLTLALDASELLGPAQYVKGMAMAVLYEFVTAVAAFTWGIMHSWKRIRTANFATDIWLFRHP